MSTIVEHGSSQKKLTIALSLGVFYFLIVAIGSFYTESLSLAANAAHMIIHNGAIVIGLIATYYAGKSTQQNYGSGYNKAEALGGYTNAILLIFMAGTILMHAVEGHEGHDHTLGLFDQEPHHVEESNHQDHHNHSNEEKHTIDGKLTFAFALAGFIIHLISMAVLSSRRKQNLCVHGAYMCIKYDVISIILSIIVGVVVMFYDWHELDLIVAAFIGLMLLYNALRLLIKSGRQLLGGIPKHISYDEVLKVLKSIDHIQGVHNLIIRDDGPKGITASVHLEMHEDCIRQNHWEPCQKEAEKLLQEKFGINYCIFQLERHHTH